MPKIVKQKKVKQVVETSLVDQILKGIDDLKTDNKPKIK